MAVSNLVKLGDVQSKKNQHWTGSQKSQGLRGKGAGKGQGSGKKEARKQTSNIDTLVDLIGDGGQQESTKKGAAGYASKQVQRGVYW